MRKTITVPVTQGMSADEVVTQLDRAHRTHEGDAKVTFDLETRWTGYGAGETSDKVITGITFTWEG